MRSKFKFDSMHAGNSANFINFEMTSKRKDDDEANTNEQEQEYPVVLQCLNCGNILGDSCSWICANQDLKSVTLRRVTNAVDSEHNLVTSEKGTDIGSTYRQLYCVMCEEILGRVYHTTPRLLDNLRDVFTLDINKIQSYQVGSGEQTTEIDTADILGPPSARSLQNDLYKIKATICALNQRIINVENSLKSAEDGDKEENQEKIEEELEEGKKMDNKTQKKPALNLSGNGNGSDNGRASGIAKLPILDHALDRTFDHTLDHAFGRAIDHALDHARPPKWKRKCTR